MLGNRLQRWYNIVPTLAERLVFAGMNKYVTRNGAVTSSVNIPSYDTILTAGFNTFQTFLFDF